MSDELELVRAYRRYLEHLAGKHNQKSHGNKYGSSDAIRGNVKRIGKDKEALKRMAKNVRALHGGKVKDALRKEQSYKSAQKKTDKANSKLETRPRHLIVKDWNDENPVIKKAVKNFDGNAEDSSRISAKLDRMENIVAEMERRGDGTARALRKHYEDIKDVYVLKNSRRKIPKDLASQMNNW